MWTKLFGLLFFTSITFTLQGYKVLEVTPSNKRESDLLANLASNYDFLHLANVNTSQILVSPDEEIMLKTFLSAHNISSKVASKDDLSEFLEKQIGCGNLHIRERLITDNYLSYDEINNYLDDLQKRFPQRVGITTAADSYEKRKIKVIMITNGDAAENKKVMFVNGGTDARDWISISTALYIIYQLVENFEENKNLLVKYDWVVMPLVNPDGYEFSRSCSAFRLWKKNRRSFSNTYGVDLNRNFGFMFGGKGTTGDPNTDDYRGPKEFSEPEAIAVRTALLSVKDTLFFYLSLHAYGDYIFYPWAFDESTCDAPNVQELRAIADAGAYAIHYHTQRKYYVGNYAKQMFASAGGSMDYAYAFGRARIALSMFLQGGGVTGYDPPSTSIAPYVKESWIGIAAMADFSELYH